MLKLPRTELKPEEVAAVESFFAKDVRPVWENSDALVSYLPVEAPLRESLPVVARTGCLTRGLETIAKLLDDEKKGLDLVQQKTGQPAAQRMSRLLLLSNDGSERFYRQVASLLKDHGNRVWTCRLDVSEGEFGRLFLGAETAVKAMLINDKKALASFLGELARRLV